MVCRSPTHPNFKEEEYIQSKIVLRYDGPGEGTRDQVKVHQQPKGTYTLPVFKGLLAVGGGHLSISQPASYSSDCQTSSGSYPGEWPATPGV